MKYAFIILVTLMSAQSFASRVETTSLTIQTEEDAIALNKKSCFSFKTSLQGIEAWDVTNFSEDMPCYILKGHALKIQTTFIDKLRSHYADVSFLGVTSIKPFASPIAKKLEVLGLQQVYEATMREIEQTEGCTVHSKIEKEKLAQAVIGRFGTSPATVLGLANRLINLMSCE